MFSNTRVLITGGTGSWGHELVCQLMPMGPKEIIIFSRNESSQVAMKRSYHDPRLSFCIGDIRDKEALMKACKGVDYVFHLAALKHVPVCEDQPYEALKTNVIGTQNVIEAAIENDVKKVVYVSTDKAANPSNFYGMTKAIGEKLIIYANLLHSNTTFVCVRGGNVLGTSESVIHIFMKQIKEQNRIGITDKRMTRFFLTMQDAIKLLFKATADSRGGEIFVMAMPTCKILDLANVLIESLGRTDVAIEEIGIRPGEKIHEILFSEFEGQNTVVYNDDYFVILPTLNLPEVNEWYAQYPYVDTPAYDSNQSLMTEEGIKELLIKGRFLL
ncbi:MAG: UDP-N-acetylglucosamine 4,6-dehydratase [Paenibacillus sp.]|jgi:FlaA1/EpsC-like NDP-sugar epimerase|nr:UDP-N-acetylglucosamine 4,6-dehydratase [Paenibacillus sp.]